MNLLRFTLFVASTCVVALTGCPKAPEFIECRDDMSCYDGGRCVANPDTDHKFCAYEDAECSTGWRWSDLDVEESISGACLAEDLPDAQVPDASVLDAATASFDVGYINVWRLGTDATSMSAYHWVRVANMGTSPLDLSTMAITNVSDDHNQIVVTVSVEPGITTQLNPGYSAGSLIPSTAQLIVNSGVMNEPAQDSSTMLIGITATNLPTPGLWLGVNAEATLQIGRVWISS
jgi:hypothetical protein